jgi:hypothetical protein
MTTDANLSVKLPEGLNLFHLNANQCEDSGRIFTLEIRLKLRINCTGFNVLVKSINKQVENWDCQYSSSKTNDCFTLQIQDPRAIMVLRIMGLLSELGTDCRDDNIFTKNGYKCCSASVVLRESVVPREQV